MNLDLQGGNKFMLQEHRGKDNQGEGITFKGIFYMTMVFQAKRTL